MNERIPTRDGSANLDPISGTPGAHPVGTGVGAVLGGAAAGAATGTVAGPVGTVIGAAVGAIVGGLAGKGVAESIDPTVEDAYWRDNYTGRSYVDSGTDYEQYRPAYGYGVDAYRRYPGRSFDEVETDLSRGWSDARGTSALEWARAKHATRDAWNRVSDTVERAVPGDSDHDGK
ncbi:MAG: hypothetical protein ABI434_16455 [Burkholderiaceae bacterium]